MPIDTKINNQPVRYRIHNKQSYINGWLSFEPAEYNGALHINTFDNSIWLSGEHLASGYGFPTFQSYVDTIAYIHNAYAYSLDYTTASYNSLYNSMLTYVDQTYIRSQHYTDIAYSRLFSYVENAYSYTMQHIDSSYQTMYNSLTSYGDYSYGLLNDNIKEIKATYITKSGDNADLGDNWISMFGNTISLNDIIFYALEHPKYSTPELSLNSSPENNSYFEVGYTIPKTIINFDFNSYANPEYDGNYGNINLGYSYGIKTLYFKHIDPETDSVFATVNEIIQEKDKFEIDNIKCKIDKDYTIVSNVELDYKKSSYMFLPKLLYSNIQYISYGFPPNQWFDDGFLKIFNKIQFKSRYKYYYGWDVNLQAFNEDFTWLNYDEENNVYTLCENCYDGWMNETNDIEESLPTLSDKISFEEDHKNFWIAYPIINDSIHIEPTEDYEILYHTLIGDQDLVCDTINKKEYITSDVISWSNKKYHLVLYSFNELYNEGIIEGGQNNYLQFTISIL